MSGKVIKWIALFTMVLDHFGASIMTCLIVYGHQSHLKPLYYCIRNVGRLAFPLFAFLLVEGFFYTKNVFKYIACMIVGALVSELPFDLAIGRTEFPYPSHQNVYFTLALGLIVISIIHFAQTNFFIQDIRRYALIAVSISIGIYISILIRCDYKWGGVSMIIGMYFAYDYLNMNRNRFKDKQAIYFITMLLGCIVICCYSNNEIYCLADPLIMIFYNGKRGSIKHKYFYYLAYPVHLLILGLVVWLAHLNVPVA